MRSTFYHHRQGSTSHILRRRVLLTVPALLSLILPSQHPVWGFDLNFGRRSNTNNNRNKNIATYQHDDASTGTVTELEPGKEKEPVTCNEIMAKAVVVANEEKAVALAKRDEAIEAARMASGRIVELEDDLTQAMEKVRELEQTMLDVEANATEAVRTAETDRDGAVAKARREAETKVIIAEANATAEIALAKAEAEDAVRVANANATRSITEARSEADAKVAAVNAEMEELRMSTSKQIENMKKENDAKLDQTKKAAQDEVDATHKNAEERILVIKNESETAVNEMKRLLEEVRAGAVQQMDAKDKEAAEKVSKAQADAEQVRKESKDEIAKVTKETELTIESIREESKRNITRIQAEAAETVSKIKTERDQIVAGVNAKMENTQKEAKEAMKKAEADAQERIKGMEDEMKKYKAKVDDERAQEKKEMENKMKELTTSHENEKKETTKKEASLKKEIEKLKSDMETKQRHLEKARKDLKYWESRPQSYCNITMFHQDSTRALGSVQRATREKLSSVTKTVVETASTVAAPHVSKTRELYNAHLAKHIDPHLKKMKEFYDAHLAKHIDNHVVPAWKTVSARITLMGTKLVEGIVSIHPGIISSVERGCRTAVKSIEDKGEDGIVPDFVTDVIRYIGEHAEAAVDLTLWLLFILLVVIYRAWLLETFSALVRRAWQVCLHISLFRFLFRKKKPIAQDPLSKVKDEGGSVKSGDSGENGVKKKDNGGTVDQPQKDKKQAQKVKAQ